MIYTKLAYLAILLLLLGCVSNYPKNVMAPPWIPAEVEDTGSEDVYRPTQKTLIPFYYSEDDLPGIDGDFSEWKGLDGALTRLAVLGGVHVPDDAEAFFVMRTDGINLYIYTRVTDDLAHENFLPGSLAWRGDTVEIFIGDNTSNHTKYLMGDNQIRLVQRSKENPDDVDVVINQRTVGSYLADGIPGAIFSSKAIYNESGYEIESSIPLKMLMIDGLKPGQKIRCDFQVNDADETERDRMVHWISTTDTPWMDPSVWGNGKVVPLPEERKEVVDEL